MAGVGGWGGVGFSLCGSSTQGPPQPHSEGRGQPVDGGGGSLGKDSGGPSPWNAGSTRGASPISPKASGEGGGDTATGEHARDGTEIWADV